MNKDRDQFWLLLVVHKEFPLKREKKHPQCTMYHGGIQSTDTQNTQTLARSTRASVAHLHKTPPSTPIHYGHNIIFFTATLCHTLRHKTNTLCAARYACAERARARHDSFSLDVAACSYHYEAYTYVVRTTERIHSIIVIAAQPTERPRI